MFVDIADDGGDNDFHQLCPGWYARRDGGDPRDIFIYSALLVSPRNKPHGDSAER